MVFTPNILKRNPSCISTYKEENQDESFDSNFKANIPSNSILSALADTGISLPKRPKFTRKTNIVGIRKIWIHLAYPNNYQ